MEFFLHLGEGFLELLSSSLTLLFKHFNKLIFFMIISLYLSTLSFDLVEFGLEVLALFLISFILFLIFFEFTLHLR